MADVLIVTALIIGFILAAILYLKLKNARLVYLINKLPGPPAHFLFGNALFFLGHRREDLFLNMFKFMQPYNKNTMNRLWFGNKAQVGILKAPALEVLLSSSRLIDKSDLYTFVHPWLGLGLLTSTGDKWRARRKLLTPSFHFRILEDFLNVFNEQAEILVTKLKKFEGKGYVDVYPFLTRCTLDVIAETAMGVKTIKAQENADSEYVQAVNNMSEIVNKRIITPWLIPNLIFNMSSYGRAQRKCLKILHNFTIKVIMEKQEELLHSKSDMKDKSEVEVLGKKRRLAFLDLLLESTCEGKKLDINDLREEVDTFMFEGHDTTAAASNWILYSIGHFPGIQEKVHEELDRIFGGSDRPVTSEDISEMKYLECVIKESLRMFPPVPFYGRKLLEEVKIGEFLLPAGIDITLPTYTIHRNTEYFPDPEKFDPSRFLPENSAGRHPYAYIPFSAGPRNCIGQKFAMNEEKVIISHVLRKFRITSQHDVKDLKFLAELVFRPFGGMWIKFESR